MSTKKLIGAFVIATMLVLGVGSQAQAQAVNTTWTMICTPNTWGSVIGTIRFANTGAITFWNYCSNSAALYPQGWTAIDRSYGEVQSISVDILAVSLVNYSTFAAAKKGACVATSNRGTLYVECATDPGFNVPAVKFYVNIPHP